MLICCDNCKAIGHPGKIGTPWCGKMGNCPCHKPISNVCTCKEPLKKENCENCEKYNVCHECGKPISTPTEGWEERFANRYLDKNSPSGLNQRTFSSYVALFKDVPNFITQEKERSVREERAEWFEGILKDYDTLLKHSDTPNFLVKELRRYREEMSEQYNEEKTSLSKL